MARWRERNRDRYRAYQQRRETTCRRRGGTIGAREGLLKDPGMAKAHWRNLMRKQLGTSVFATLFLALTAGLAVGHTPPPAAGPSTVIKVAKQTTTPPRISATGLSHRSRTASTKGANARGFCPPGQRRKPGRGSAFHC